MASRSGEKYSEKEGMEIDWFAEGLSDNFLKKREEGVIRVPHGSRSVWIFIPFQQDISPFLLVYMRVVILLLKSFESPGRVLFNRRLQS
jgi:hypothetical protein